MSITEQPNELTLNIDISTSSSIIDILASVDNQLFAGYNDYESLLSSTFLSSFKQVAEQIKSVLADNGIVVMSGAGTSGRLAYLCCRYGNEFLSKSSLPGTFIPLIAGGLPAIMTAQEGAEDSPTLARADLSSVLDARPGSSLLYIGITCGLSAPYVGAQLEFCLELSELNCRRVYPVVMGFNPVDLARDSIVPKWNNTFKKVLDDVVKRGGVALCPVVGPEGITGSTRMKGGSATLLLLLLLIESSQLGQKVEENLIESRIVEIKQSVESLYNQLKSSIIPNLIDQSTTALRQKGSIVYLGHDFAGQLAIIDASECPPTFGALDTDVISFIYNGWSALNLDSNSEFARSFKVDLKEFIDNNLELNPKDVVFVVCIDGKIPNILTEYLSVYRSNLFIINIYSGNNNVIIPNYSKNLVEFLVSADNVSKLLCLKLVLNCISTSSHVFLGKVYQNRMVDLRLSNTKLLTRSTITLSKLLDINISKAKEIVLRSVYESQEIPEDASDLDHVTVASAKKYVVPIAISMALGFSLEKSREMVEHCVENGIAIRSHIIALMNGNCG
ncbi:hypothetical protein RCL1_001822 [Eukaryota sp. TZLM3-RCL]